MEEYLDGVRRLGHYNLSCASPIADPWLHEPICPVYFHAVLDLVPRTLATDARRFLAHFYAAMFSSVIYICNHS